jgi:hypothetical protein
MVHYPAHHGMYAPAQQQTGHGAVAPASYQQQYMNYGNYGAYQPAMWYYPAMQQYPQQYPGYYYPAYAPAMSQ